MARQYSLENGKIRIKDVSETVLEEKDIDMQLQAIAREKLRLMEQNRLIVDRYNGLLAEEARITEIISQIGGTRLEVIGEDTKRGIILPGEENV